MHVKINGPINKQHKARQKASTVLMTRYQEFTYAMPLIIQ